MSFMYTLERRPPRRAWASWHDGPVKDLRPLRAVVEVVGEWEERDAGAGRGIWRGFFNLGEVEVVVAVVDVRPEWNERYKARQCYSGGVYLGYSS
jgi:hypothetical protein